jgi:hypothetical protein
MDESRSAVPLRTAAQSGCASRTPQIHLATHGSDPSRPRSLGPQYRPLSRRSRRPRWSPWMCYSLCSRGSLSVCFTMASAGLTTRRPSPPHLSSWRSVRAIRAPRNCFWGLYSCIRSRYTNIVWAPDNVLGASRLASVGDARRVGRADAGAGDAVRDNAEEWELLVRARALQRVQRQQRAERNAPECDMPRAQGPLLLESDHQQGPVRGQRLA